ncbi:MAG: hypothetical protein Q9220_000937 [cf. Caloplaca sp. 1 TL-2023]
MGHSNSAALEDYVHKVYEDKPKYASRNPENQFFRLGPSAPQLYKDRINRLLLYYGCFNPPHGGHLRLLRHVFYHGTHGLDVCAAIIHPSANASCEKKLQREGNGFILGREERCMLWKRDLCFPHWAWVYEGGNGSYNGFLERLQRVADEDGFKIEYVRLSGPVSDDPENPPGPELLVRGSENYIISDAARTAKYQRSSGRIRNFSTFSKWKQLPFHEESWRKTIDLQQQALEDHWQSQTEIRCESEDRKLHIDESVEMVRRDMANILYCKKLTHEDRPLTLRFVKTKESKSEKSKEHAISSTILRNAMSGSSDSRAKTYIYSMALSADILWNLAPHWQEKARARKNELVTFEPDKIALAELKMESKNRERADNGWDKEMQDAELAMAEQSMSNEGDRCSQQGHDQQEDAPQEDAQQKGDQQENAQKEGVQQGEAQQEEAQQEEAQHEEAQDEDAPQEDVQEEEVLSLSEEKLLHPQEKPSQAPKELSILIKGRCTDEPKQGEQGRGVKRKRTQRREVSGPAVERLEKSDEGSQKISECRGGPTTGAQGSEEQVTPQSKVRTLVAVLVEIKESEEKKKPTEGSREEQESQDIKLRIGEARKGKL